MDLRKALVHSRKLPAKHVETLWENIYKHNVKMDTLTSILGFYLHHRFYPPPVQRAFDTLLMKFTDTKATRKMKTLLFQIVEEMCHWLSPSCIIETVKLSSSPSIVAELLPCLLINKDIPRPDTSVYERLLSALTTPGLSQGERCKVLGFLMEMLPTELQPLLNKQLIAWLSYSRTAQKTGSLFRSADVTEIDGTPGMGMCTALTLVSTITDLHLLSLVAFSSVRRFLLRSPECTDGSLVNALFIYCNSLLAQASKKPTSPHDKQLIAAVLEELVLLMGVIRDIDPSCKGRCLLIVRNTQQIADQLRLSSLLVSIWEYHLSQGEENSLTERLLGSVVKAEFSQGQIAQRIALVAASYATQLGSQLTQFTPNLMKLIATHPSTLVEEFLTIVPHLGYDSDLVVEVLHCLLDLPILSASICVHQTALLVQAGFRVPAMVTVKQMVEAEHKTVHEHFLRTTATKGQTDTLLAQYSNYLTTLKPIFSLGLVEVCSQVTPLLLQVFLESVSGRAEVNRLVLSSLLTRASLLCPLTSFQTAVFNVLPSYISTVSQLEPELLESPSVAQFLSVVSHSQLCPQLFQAIVETVGEHVHTETVIMSLFETLEAALREILVEKMFKTELGICLCTSLAKLASRNTSLIPRAITAFEKFGNTLQRSTEEEKEAVLQQVNQLIRVLKNPRLASVVLCPTSKEDVAIAALIRVLFQFLE